MQKAIDLEKTVSYSHLSAQYIKLIKYRCLEVRHNWLDQVFGHLPDRYIPPYSETDAMNVFTKH